jgi:hypothetical protein
VTSALDSTVTSVPMVPGPPPLALAAR